MRNKMGAYIFSDESERLFSNLRLLRHLKIVAGRCYTGHFDHVLGELFIINLCHISFLLRALPLCELRDLENVDEWMLVSGNLIHLY